VPYRDDDDEDFKKEDDKVKSRVQVEGSDVEKAGGEALVTSSLEVISGSTYTTFIYFTAHVI